MMRIIVQSKDSVAHCRERREGWQRRIKERLKECVEPE